MSHKTFHASIAYKELMYHDDWKDIPTIKVYATQSHIFSVVVCGVDLYALRNE